MTHGIQYVFMCLFIRCHYPKTNSSSEALETGKALWASEDYSTFNNDIGGECWAKVYINSKLSILILVFHKLLLVKSKYNRGFKTNVQL